MLFSSDWQILVVLSILTFFSVNCEPRSKNGTVSSVFATIGHRISMEDYFIHIESDSGYGIFGIFDGHGGDFAAKFAAEFFPQKIQNEVEKFPAPHKCRFCIIKRPELSFERILTNAIQEAEAHLKKEFVEKRQGSGTTCLLMIAQARKLTVANVGDSRAVMCNINGTAIDLTTDHRPDNAAEKQRIEKEGGDMHQIDGVWRVNGLAMSRSLGDHSIDLDKKCISAKPDISTYDLDEHRSEFMILASDGIWNVISSQEAVDFIRERYSCQRDFGARELVMHAMHGTHVTSKDNITVVIVRFNKNGHYKVCSARA